MSIRLMGQNFSNCAIYHVFCFSIPSFIGALVYDT